MADINEVLLLLGATVIIVLINSLLVWAAVHFKSKDLKDSSYSGGLVLSIYFGLIVFVLSFLTLPWYVSTLILLISMYLLMMKYHNLKVKETFNVWVVWFGLFIAISLILGLVAYLTNMVRFPGLF